LQHHLCKLHRNYNINKISLETEQNVNTFLRLLKPDSCQTQQHQTDRLTSDSRQKQTPPDPTTGVTKDSFDFLATRVATVGT
jgi:hypothetical protein